MRTLITSAFSRLLSNPTIELLAEMLGDDAQVVGMLPGAELPPVLHVVRNRDRGSDLFFRLPSFGERRDALQQIVQVREPPANVFRFRDGTVPDDVLIRVILQHS